MVACSILFNLETRDEMINWNFDVVISALCSYRMARVAAMPYVFQAVV